MAIRESARADLIEAEHTSLTATIVAEIAEFKGVEPTKLRTPLYDVVDIEALESLFGPRSDEAPALDGYVSFAIDGCVVRIDSDGAVSVVEA